MMMILIAFCKILKHFTINNCDKIFGKNIANPFKNFKNTTTFRRWLNVIIKLKTLRDKRYK